MKKGRELTRLWYISVVDFIVDANASLQTLSISLNGIGNHSKRRKWETQHDR